MSENLTNLRILDEIGTKKCPNGRIGKMKLSRFGENYWMYKMKLTPLRAIKKHCLECSGYEKKQVRECVIRDCVLFSYRQGNNPNRKRTNANKNGLSTTGFEKEHSLVLRG